MTKPTVLGVVFVAVLGAVLGTAVVSEQLGESSTDAIPEIENEQYLDDDLLSSRTPGTANVSMNADVEPQTILIDPGNAPESREARSPRSPFARLAGFGPETTERDLQPLINALIRNGHTVRIYTPSRDDGRTRPPVPSARNGGGETLTALGQDLAQADAFVTFRTDYTAKQLDEIRTFVEADGRVFMATDPADAYGRPGAGELQSALGVTTMPGYVYNMATNDLNYQRVFARPAASSSSSLTEGVERAVFATATPVAAATGGAALVPTDGTELSTSRRPTDAAVMVRNGDVVLAGDTNFLRPENVRRADNDELVGNIADFLVTNERSPETQPPEQRTRTEAPRSTPRGVPSDAR